MSIPAHALNAQQLTDAYSRKTLSPIEVTRATLDAAAASQSTLNAFVVLDADAALAAARASEQRWGRAAPLSALDGVPVSIKDNIYVGGMPTRFGSVAIPEADTQGPDSPAVSRLREGGAVIFGKTTTPDYAHKIVTDSPLTGVTRNPCNLAYTPGGSSGGAAAAVAAGIGPIAIGTDGGGSIRIPAAWSGVFGFKPSFGRVPHYPRGAFGPVSHVGPLSRTVADAARAMNLLSRPDSRDWYALPPRELDYELALTGPAEPLRIAFSPRLGLADVVVEPEVARAVERAARLFESLGAAVEQADPPAMRDCAQSGGVLWVSMSAHLARQLGERASRLDASLLALAEYQQELPPYAFIEACLGRGEIGARVNGFFEQYDLLLCPVIHCTAPRLAEIDPVNPPRPSLTVWCNLIGLPAASIPCGYSQAGLPIGLQIVGRRWADETVLRASQAFERAHGGLCGIAAEQSAGISTMGSPAARSSVTGG